MGKNITRDLKIYNKFIKGSPIMLNKTRLIYDNERNGLMLEITLNNFSDRDIKSVCFIAKFYDNEGRLLRENEKLVVKEKINKLKEFTNKKLISISEKDTFYVFLIIYSVEFDDGSIWINKGKKEGIDVLEKIYIEDKVLRDAFKWKDSLVSLNNYPIFTKEYYICSCGKIHTNDVDSCNLCGVSKEELLKTFNIKNIKKVIKDYKKNSDMLEDDVLNEFNLPKKYTSDDDISIFKIVLLIVSIIILVYVIYFIIENVLF